MKRQPSAPWLGWLVVTGMSASVMPMRSTVSAAAPPANNRDALSVSPNIDLVIGFSLTQRNGKHMRRLDILAECGKPRRLGSGDGRKLGRAGDESLVGTLDTNVLDECGNVIRHENLQTLQDAGRASRW